MDFVQLCLAWPCHVVLSQQFVQLRLKNVKDKSSVVMQQQLRILLAVLGTIRSEEYLGSPLFAHGKQSILMFVFRLQLKPLKLLKHNMIPWNQNVDGSSLIAVNEPPHSELQMRH